MINKQLDRRQWQRVQRLLPRFLVVLRFFSSRRRTISLCSARQSSMALRRALLSLRPSTAPSVARAFGTAPTGPVTVAERS